MKCKVSLDSHGCTPKPSKMFGKEQINKILEIGKGALKAPPPPTVWSWGDKDPNYQKWWEPRAPAPGPDSYIQRGHFHLPPNCIGLKEEHTVV